MFPYSEYDLNYNGDPNDSTMNQLANPNILGASTTSGGTGNADQMWNEGWNVGFNSGGAANTNNDPNFSSGYNTGWQEYLKRNTKTGSNPNPAPVGNNDTGPSAEDQLRSEIESIFNPVFAELEAQKGDVKNEFNVANQGIEEQYGLSQASLGEEKTTATEGLQTQETEAGGRKEDALTSATRLYDELKRGGQQRFGGASSAGEAFQSLTAVEQQRRQGAIMGAYEGAMQKVGQYKAELDRKYILAQKELELQKNEAMRGAQAEFDKAMAQIRNNTAIAQSDKANATLTSLQDLRNKVYTINLQTLQFQQQLAANKLASTQKVDQYTQAFANQLLGGQNAVLGMNTSAANQTAYSAATQPQTQATTPQYIGSIRRDEEKLG